MELLKKYQQPLLYIGAGVLIILAIFIAKEFIIGLLAAVAYIFKPQGETRDEVAERHERASRAAETAQAGQQIVEQLEKRQAQTRKDTAAATEKKINDFLDGGWK